MKESKSKTKKVVLILSIILAILICIGSVGYIWYSHSPFPTVLKMVTAFQNGDMDTVLECIEPETAQKLKLVVAFTGMSVDDLFDSM